MLFIEFRYLTAYKTTKLFSELTQFNLLKIKNGDVPTLGRLHFYSIQKNSLILQRGKCHLKEVAVGVL